MNIQQLGFPGVALCAVVLGMAAMADNNPLPGKGDVVARFRGGEITGEDFDAYILSLPEHLRAPMDSEDLPAWRRRMAKKLLVEELLIVEAREAGLLEQPAFTKAWNRARDRILADAMLEQVSVEMPVVTPEDIAAYYETNKARFRRHAAILTSHIFLRADAGSDRSAIRRKLEGIREEILAGADFAEMAKRYSDSENAKDGGLLPWQRRGTLPAAYESAAWNLAIGEVSDIVETEWGFHIIRLERREEDGFLPLSQVSAGIEKELRTAALQNAEQELLRDLAARVGLDSPEKLVEARKRREYGLLARAARERGLEFEPGIEEALRGEWRKLAGQAARGRRQKAWTKTLDENRLRAFYDGRSNRYQSPPRFDLAVFQLLFDAGRPQMETRLAAEECARLLQSGREEEARNMPGVKVITVKGVTPRELVRRASRELAKAVRKLAVGQVSAPLRLERYQRHRLVYEHMGYWIVRLEGREEPALLPYEAVKDLVRDQYVTRHAEDFRDTLVRGLMEKYAGEILVE